MITIYEATQNSDLTEGRGSMVTVAFFTNEADAVEAVKGRGVMGVGDGEVFAVKILESMDEFKPENRFARWQKEKVYGYRQDLAGKWGHGWVDNRDAPVNDPEYMKYVELKKKFEGG